MVKVEIQHHAILTSALDVSGQIHAPAASPPITISIYAGLQSQSGRL